MNSLNLLSLLDEGRKLLGSANQGTHNNGYKYCPHVATVSWITRIQFVMDNEPDWLKEQLQDHCNVARRNYCPLGNIESIVGILEGVIKMRQPTVEVRFLEDTLIGTHVYGPGAIAQLEPDKFIELWKSKKAYPVFVG